MPRSLSPFVARLPAMLRIRRPERSLADLDTAALRDIGLRPDQVRERDAPATNAIRYAIAAAGHSRI